MSDFQFPPGTQLTGPRLDWFSFRAGWAKLPLVGQAAHYWRKQGDELTSACGVKVERDILWSREGEPYIFDPGTFQKCRRCARSVKT